MSVHNILQASPALPRGLSHEELAGRLYVGPAGTLSGGAAGAAMVAGQGWPLAGGTMAFALCQVLLREGGRVYQAVAPFTEVLDWSGMEGEATAQYVGGLLNRLAARRPDFAGLSMDRPRLMGIVNVTPDSFSDGGRYHETDAAIAHGLALREAGADILDIGGESTRPGADPVSPEEEMRRVLPVVRAFAERGIVVSVDTRHAAVMGAAVDAGAAIINDISALEGDPRALDVAAKSGASVILMHMQGDPRSMQKEPQYEFAPLDVYDYLASRLETCRSAGIPADRLCVDPGVGFGKTVDHNLQILAYQGLYHALGVPVLIGVSRKAFIGKLSRGEPAPERVAGSLAVAVAAWDLGAQIVRVHDVADTAQALAVWQAMRGC